MTYVPPSTNHITPSQNSIIWKGSADSSEENVIQTQRCLTSWSERSLHPPWPLPAPQTVLLYNGSFWMGWPRYWRWTLIWCIRPVSGKPNEDQKIKKKKNEKLIMYHVYNLNTVHSVLIMNKKLLKMNWKITSSISALFCFPYNNIHLFKSI